MLEESVSEIKLSDDENDVFQNGSQKPSIPPFFSNECDTPTDPSYTQFEPVVSKPFIVSVVNPEKVGYGMSSYIVYHVQFEGLAPPFLGIKSAVVRRFSDFFHMYEKLVSKHLPNGIIVPPAPGKELLDTTRLKISKNEYLEKGLVERRRFALKRFLSRLFHHPVISTDKDLLDFIQETETPRTSTQAISSSNAKRFIKNLGGAFRLVSYEIDENDDLLIDDYFYTKSEVLVAWERQLKRLRTALANLDTAEQELASAKVTESQALTGLANAEEATGLARAWARLSETEEQVGQVEATLANSLLLHLIECVVDVLDLIQAAKDALVERVRTYRSWQEAKNLQRNKVNQTLKLELTGKADRKKLDQLDVEFNELECRVTAKEKHFEAVSKTLKLELERLDVNRFIEVKEAAIKHLEVMLCAQSKVLGYWETFLTHANSIVT